MGGQAPSRSRVIITKAGVCDQSANSSPLRRHGLLVADQPTVAPKAYRPLETMLDSPVEDRGE